MTIGDKGIIKVASQASYESKIANYKEELNLIALEIKTDELISEDGTQIYSYSEKLLSAYKERIKWYNTINNRRKK